MLLGNLKSHFFTTKIFLPIIPNKPTSNIIFMSSVSGYVSFELIGVYSITKTALIALTETIAKDFVNNDI